MPPRSRSVYDGGLYHLVASVCGIVQRHGLQLRLFSAQDRMFVGQYVGEQAAADVALQDAYMLADVKAVCLSRLGGDVADIEFEGR